MIVLETERLTLRHLTLDDDQFIYGLMNEPAYIENIGDRNIHSFADAGRYIQEKLTPSYQQHGYGLYAVESKSDQQPIGIAGFVKREILEAADIGFAFLSNHRQRGYGYEAASHLMEYGRAKLSMTRIFGVTSPTNHSSIQLLQKLGLRFERMIRLPTYDRESMLFSTDTASRPENQSPPDGRSGVADSAEASSA